MLFIGLWHLLVFCPLTYMVWMPLGIVNYWLNDYGGEGGGSFTTIHIGGAAATIIYEV